MTSAKNSMDFFAKERVPAVGFSNVQANVSNADAEARRLAMAIGRGDEVAFQQLYDTYHGRVFRLLLALSRADDSLAQDVVQLVFLTAAKKLRYAESEAHLWNWLARVARQQLGKSRRRQQKDSTLVSVAELPESVAGNESDTMLENALDCALKELGVDDGQLVEKFYFERLSQKEIAIQLGITPKAVSSRLDRAREKLRIMIGRNLSRET